MSVKQLKFFKFFVGWIVLYVLKQDRGQWPLVWKQDIYVEDL